MSQQLKNSKLDISLSMYSLPTSVHMPAFYRFAKQSYCIQFQAPDLGSVYIRWHMVHNIVIFLSYKPFETCQILLRITEGAKRFL